MTRTALAALCLGAALAQPAAANTLDVSTLKCSELMAMNQDEGSYIMVWLHGYYGGQANDTTIDLNGFEAAGQAIGQKCGENPDLGVMTAIQQLFQNQ